MILAASRAYSNAAEPHSSGALRDSHAASNEPEESTAIPSPVSNNDPVFRRVGGLGIENSSR